MSFRGPPGLIEPYAVTCAADAEVIEITIRAPAP